MSKKEVTIDITKRPENTQNDGKGGYYYESNSGRVNLTEEWYPDLEGTYIKLTHTPKNPKEKITGIFYSRSKQNGFEQANLSSCESISVFYWSLDSTRTKPLLIQLGERDNEYYTNNRGNTWTKNGDINDANTLRQKLDEQNCLKNGAHLIDIGQKGSGRNYNCPSCSQQKLRVYYSSGPGTPYYGHHIRNSFPGSLSGFKNGSSWPSGLPSVQNVKFIFVYWNRSVPSLIVAQSRPERYFRINAGNLKSWIEVSDKSTDVATPTLALDLSKTDGKYPYRNTNAKIIVAVLLSHIGGGYYRLQYSLRGSLFNVKSVSHNDTQLSGIDSTDLLLSVSAYYLGDSPESLDRLLLVELSINATHHTTYKYFHRETKGAKVWSKYLGSGGGTTRLQGNALKRALDELKNIHFPDPPPSIGKQIADFFQKTEGIITASVTPGIGGLIGLGIWKGPALIARLIARL
ncbi:hypothetical protein BEWA_054060 [Theileria equi strain WA]|uniref:Uncharacterized protein n=1 Tax=Theileria equi strain WA TaxID=1537102 RepID=L1LDM8_THEEQ|nr:hypothetical protein BEWA_054060 [Theileria equi strain WA]EKX73350.1 hypothetical protein BEWA_054060 [Theileria equi strain WA]|eukprot:XP_004832802.1 hypothetical protein BEWA_054060 [Theileria equi strain WA]